MADKFVSAEAAELIEKSITEVVEANGYEVVEIKYFKEYGRYNLTVFIWSKDGVDLNGCETVHNALDPIMDKYGAKLCESFTEPLRSKTSAFSRVFTFFLVFSY